MSVVLRAAGLLFLQRCFDKMKQKYRSETITKENNKTGDVRRNRSVEPTKKMLIINILDILRKYTDAEHTLRQKDIIDILKKEYGMKAERKAVRRNIQNLIDMGYEIEYTETTRMVQDPKTKEMEESIITSDYYIVRDFTDGELRLLIDGLLSSRHIEKNQCKELARKLESLSNVYFKSHVKHISTIPKAAPQNPEIFYTIEVLDEAIEKKKKVSFTYIDYGTDKKPYRKCRDDGTVREYIVSPYQMAARDGKYYLICNYDKYDDISNYRIDRIKDISILDETAKPFEKLEGSGGKRLDLSEYMDKHIYMYSSGDIRVKFRIVKAMITDIIDIFGEDVSFSNETDTHVDVSARVSEDAMFQFAKRYAPDVLVLEPERLVKRLREDATETLKAYEEL